MNGSGDLQLGSSPICPHDVDALARALVLNPSHDAVRALARAYLEADEGVRLAHEALEAGPHAVRRGIELAALVLAQVSESNDSAPHPGALATKGRRP